jgi:hypothetical protein
MSDTLDRTETRETLWVTDAELIRRMGVPEKIAREALQSLDTDPRRTGFPQKQKLWGDRRYWPAVRTWLDNTNKVTLAPSSTPRPRND